MFQIVERREIAQKVFLDGWQHFPTRSIRYFHNERRDTALPGTFDRNTVVQLPVPPNRSDRAPNEAFADELSEYQGRFIPAAVVEQIEDERWSWKVWLHNEVNPVAEGDHQPNRRWAVEAADRSLGKVLGLDIDDGPLIPWELTDRIFEMETEISLVLGNRAFVGMNYKSEPAQRLRKLLDKRRPFAEWSELVERRKASG